jgi:4-amino-4-deoxy-L-arabinose transferase-like glycosyltransferase
MTTGVSRRVWSFCGPALIPALLVLGTTALYLPGLQHAPAFLSNDEVCIALNARAVAATGRDLEGRFMPPLFYSPPFYLFNGARIWFLPILVYAVALVLKILPFTETAIRLPLVIAAVVDVLLVYLIGRVLFERTRVAVFAAVLLALTPSHFAHARLALPAQLSGPFVLGWLLCTLIYLRRHDPRVLFTGGVLLGLAAISYIGPLVVVYFMLTCTVLYLGRQRRAHYGALIAGALLPCVYFLFLVRDTTALSEILGHYRQSDAGLDVFARAVGIAALFWNFWSPHFLFIEGAVRNARAAGVIGVFLLPMAGLLVVGVVCAVRRSTPQTILLLGGFFSAPGPASFVGEGHAIWRALEVAPFGVLLAAYGLEQLLTEDTARARWTAFVATFAVPIALAVAYHDDLRHAQPMVRVLLVPLVVAGLAMLLRRLAAEWPTPGSLVAALAALVMVHLAYVVGDANLVNVLVPILAVLGFAASEAGGVVGRRLSGPVVVTVLTLLASQFMVIHVDYRLAYRVGSIPASAVALAVRLTVAAVVVPALLGVAVLLRRLGPEHLGGATLVTAPSTWPATTLVTAAALMTAVLQVAYFYVGYSSGYLLRFVHVSAVLLLAVGLAAVLSRGGPDRRMLARLGGVALLTAAFMQFGHFYVDYFTEYPARNVSMMAGNVRMAWEDVIDRAHDRPVPAIFMGTIGPYEDAGLYWRFYLIKHHREDLLARTIEGEPFDANRLRRLPSGSLLITSPSGKADTTIEEMKAAGEVRPGAPNDLIRAPDGTPLFWILERSAH